MSPIERLWLVAAPAPELSVRRKLKTNPQEIDILDELTKLAAQRTVGVLTPEGYETKLADLRARLSI